jgi:Na+-driven multidrug efflux pump
VATRIEGFAIAIMIALSTGISPFVGQNFGAGNIGRIRQALSYSKTFSVAWGLFLFTVFFFFARPLAGLFNSNFAVIESAALYLWLVPISLGLRGIHQIIWTALNVLGRPYDAMGLEFLLAICLWIPLGLAGGAIAQIGGVYAGLSLANIIAGAVAIVWAARVMETTKKKLAGSDRLSDLNVSGNRPRAH